MKSPYYWLIGSYIEPEDDFSQRLRKNVAGFCCFPGAPMALFQALAVLSRLDGSVPVLVPFIFNVILGLAWIGTYVSGRRMRHIGGSHASTIVWVYLLRSTMASLVTPQYDGKGGALMAAFIGVFLEVPGIPVFLIACLLSALLNDWNTANLANPSSFILLPGYDDGLTPSQILLANLSVTAGLCVVACTFVLVITESNRRGKAQTAANEMTVAILKHQRKYNTAEIADVIEQCKAEGVVDAELLELYHNMNNNLESYRPFLPNYLFNDDTSSDDGLADAQDNKADEDAEGEIFSGSASRRGFGDEASTSILSPSDSRTVTQLEASFQSNQYATRTKRGILFNGLVTFALVDINVERLMQTEFSGKPAGDILKAVVRSVYSVAKETKASVHSMLGDTVQLTWNATNSVALSETKGAVFLARLAKRFQAGVDVRNPNLSQPSTPSLRRALGTPTKPLTSELSGTLSSLPAILCAAICTGKASVHNITTDSQQALVIEAPWLPVLEGCFDLAKRVGNCVLMDERTAKGCHLEVETSAVEMARYSAMDHRTTFLGKYPAELAITETREGEGLFGTSTVIHQLLREHQRADDEWMYQLQQGDNGKEATENPSALRLKAVKLVAEGRVKEGLEALASSETTSSNSTTASGTTATAGGSRERSYSPVVNPVFTKALEAKSTLPECC